MGTEHVRIAIIGSGFAGLGAAIRLKQEGVQGFAILEREHEVGGVWRDNTYPGCACDVQSHLYSFSFAPNPTWTRSYSPQGEIQSYLRGCAERFGVLPHVRFGHEVRASRWDEESRRWVLETSRGTITADAVIAATGALSDPRVPEIPGRERFAGPAFHSARWRHDVELRGKRVAVIGTGASAIQFVPAIQPEVARLTLFQRTPPWVLPRANLRIPRVARAIYAKVPLTQRLVREAISAFRDATHVGFKEGPAQRWVQRQAVRYLARTVRDPVLRAKLTPDYKVGCKRILLSDEYLPALVQPNVEVVADAIREIRERSIVTAGGAEHEVDAIVYGTGFHVTDQPIARWIRGRDGRTLEEVWDGSPRAHLGTTIAGFPNFFLMQGPNTGLGHSSVILMIEAQIEHVLDVLRHLDRTGAAIVEPRPEAQEAFAAECDRGMQGSVWTAGGCASWYLDRTGRNSTLWPGTTISFRKRLERFHPSDFRLEGHSASRWMTWKPKSVSTGAEIASIASA